MCLMQRINFDCVARAWSVSSFILFYTRGIKSVSDWGLASQLFYTNSLDITFCPFQIYKHWPVLKADEV